MLLVFVIDENGFVINTEVTTDTEPKVVGNKVSIQPTETFYKYRWIDGKWIEGATQEEIDELTKVEPSPPTEVDLLKEELANTNAMLLDMMELLLGGI